MKAKVEVDCTPAEARAFLGLPDVSSLNEHMVQEMKSRLDANLAMVAPGRVDAQLDGAGRPGVGAVHEADDGRGGRRSERRRQGRMNDTIFATATAAGRAAVAVVRISGPAIMQFVEGAWLVRASSTAAHGDADAHCTTRREIKIDQGLVLRFAAPVQLSPARIVSSCICMAAPPSSKPRFQPLLEFRARGWRRRANLRAGRSRMASSTLDRRKPSAI